MSWAIGYDENWKRDIGYGVPATCDHPGCGKVIDRGLAYVCGGEPYGGDHGCGLRYWDRHFPEEKPLAHGVAVHVPRKLAAAKKYGRGYARRLAAQFKVRLAAEDVVAAMADAPDPSHPPAADDIDVPVIRRKEG